MFKKWRPDAVLAHFFRFFSEGANCAAGTMRRRSAGPGGAIPQGNRRYILYKSIEAISDATFLIFFQNNSTLHRVYNPIRAFLKK